MKYTPVLLLFLLLSCSSTGSTRVKRIEVNLNSPRISLGTVEAVFDAFVSKTGTKSGQVEVYYFPEQDVICLQTNQTLLISYQFWNRENRETFVKGLEQYKLEYEQRNLSNKNTQTRKKYGRVPGYLIWQSTRVSDYSWCYPDYDIGYQFKNNAPYFSIFVREMPNENEKMKENNPTSTGFGVYFTRALADEMAALFNEDVLRSIRQGQSPGGVKQDAW